MQISDLLGQYTQNTQTAVSDSSGVKSVEQLVSTIREMAAGTIFEGTINEIQNGQVLLGLSNGEQISARMDGQVALLKGQSMFFQVKTNDGTTVAIRPFMVDGQSGNLTLYDALKAAGLPADSKNLNMVNGMMQEQLPIDKGHLGDMARLVQKYPNADLRTIIQMTKLNLPVTEENLSQFENYRMDERNIQAKMEQIIEQLPEVMDHPNAATGQLADKSARILMVIAGNGMQETEAKTPDLQDPAQTQTTTAQQTAAQQEYISEPLVSRDVLQKLIPQLENIGMDCTEFQNMLERKLEVANPEAVNPETASADTGMPDTDFLRQLAEFLKTPDTQSAIPKKALQTLLSGRELQGILKETLESQWELRPQDLTKEHSVRQLYERLDRQMQQLEEVVKAQGNTHSGLEQTVADIRANVNFMDQLNQVYHYVQLPLRMSGQRANGELYVYTNKKALQEADQEITAFLHLDMEHLGSTDVSLRLWQKEITTNFYIEDDLSYAVLCEHLPELEKRLEEKGYTCNLKVTNEPKKMDFVDDFLKKDQPPTGKLRRYSFDMRA
mgnify:FL=1